MDYLYRAADVIRCHYDACVNAVQEDLDAMVADAQWLYFRFNDDSCLWSFEDLPDYTDYY